MPLLVQLSKIQSALMKQISCCLLMCLVLMPLQTLALSLQDLIDRGELSVKLSLSPQRISVGQQATLTIEIATNRWFGGGTTIKTPLSDDLLLIQRQRFAVNSTERRAGQTWVLQRWSLSLFPRRAGAITVPPIALSFAVNAERDGLVVGALNTAALPFSAYLPESLPADSDWLASPVASINLMSDQTLSNLVIGDAFTLTYTLQAEDLMAMMLPEISLPAIPGLAIYPAIAQLKDDSNRGANSASRSSEFAFVVEAAGQYTIPAQSILWWNTDQQQLQVLATEAQVFTVAAHPPAARVGVTAMWLQPWHRYTAVLSVLLLIVLLVRRAQNDNRVLKHRPVKALQRQFAEAIAARQWHNAVAVMYRWVELREEGSLPDLLSEIQLRGSPQQPPDDLAEQLERLFTQAYSRENTDQISRDDQFVALVDWVAAAKRASPGVNRWRRLRKKGPPLQLNPRD